MGDLAGPGSQLSPAKIRKLEKMSDAKRAAMTYDEGLIGIGKPVSARMTYNDWLKTQSKVVQTDALGPKRYKLWKDNKLSMSDMVSQAGRPLSVKDLEDRYGDIAEVVAAAPVRPSPLSSSPIRGTKEFDGGVSIVNMVDLGMVKGQKLQGVFKPTHGENWTIMNSITNKSFRLGDREVMAYEIDKTLGFNMVPETVIRTVGNKRGSLQRFVDDAVQEDFWEGRNLRPPERYRIGVFDYITGSADRQKHNYLRMKKTGAPMLIDNGYAFPKPRKKYFNGLSEFNCEPLDGIYENLDKALTATEKAALIRRIKKIDVNDLQKRFHLSNEEATALRYRINNIAEKIKENGVNDFFMTYKNRTTVEGFAEGVEAIEAMAAEAARYENIGGLYMRGKGLITKGDDLRDYRNLRIKGLTPATNSPAKIAFDGLTERQQRKLLEGVKGWTKDVDNIGGLYIKRSAKLQAQAPILKEYRDAIIKGQAPSPAAVNVFNELSGRQQKKLLLGVKKAEDVITKAKEVVTKAKEVTVGVSEEVGGKLVWVRVSTREETRKAFEKLGWGRVDLSNMPSDRSAMEAINRAGETMTDLFNRFPELRKGVGLGDELSKGWNFELMPKASFLSDAGNDVLGTYNQAAHELRIAAGLNKKVDRLRIGKLDFIASDTKERVINFGVGGDFASVLRHEWGHHWHRNIMNSRQSMMWREIFSESGGLDWFKHNISIYSGKDLGEAFAECFSAYTSPLYGIKYRLPRTLEEFFEKYVGKV